MTKHAIRLAIALAVLVSVPAASTGCAAIMPVIPKIVSVLADAASTLAIIDTAVQEWFRLHPDVQPETRAKYVAIYTRTMRAMNAAQTSLRGVEKLDQEQYDAAFEDFKRAYIELRDFLSTEGMMQNGRMSAGGEDVEIPEPEALRFQVDG